MKCVLLAFLPQVLPAVLEIPSVFGSVYPLNPTASDVTSFLKARPGDFVHPGIWHTREDLDRIRTGVLEGIEPWASAYAAFSADPFSQSTYTMRGPHAILSRGGSASNYSSLTADARAAWQNALMYTITRNTSHSALSARILDAWGTNLTAIIGIDRSLLIGLEGDLLVNAAELLRHTANWTEAGSSWRGGSGFSAALYWLFARQTAASASGQANYGMVSIKALLSFAVYLDDVALYNYAVNAFVRDPCAGVLAMYEPSTGQSVEAGRDQGHTQSGIAWSAYGARVAQSQGSDLYSLGDNLLLKAGEYAAAFNLNQTVPYDPKWYRCEAVLVGGPWSEISTESFGIRSSLPAWNVLYYEYVVRRGLEGSWISRARGTGGYFEGSVTSDDHPSWGDLIWA
ncbi:chondroitin AC/alginate lyase, partial [Macrophomina phaseolina]